MADRKLRALTFGLLASTALATPAFAQDAPPPTDPAGQPSAAAAPAEPEGDVIIVTATKREENLQDVPVSIQAIGTRRLDQLNISNFEDYTKQLPSVSFQTAAPGFTTVYMRGVASGGDGNHTGSLPSVGFYLDEQPVTTIGGTLDVHIYDIARIESLAGPQGTLYGASSQAGTIRIITNKPELGVTSGRIDAEINKVAHGGWGGSLEGMINLPVTDNIAFRASAFYQRDAGYIDNVFGERTYCGDPTFDEDGAVNGCIRNGFSVDNAEFVKDNFNTNKTYGGRAALKIDLDENWTITPQIMHQNSKTKGVFYMDADLDDLETQRFREEPAKDKFTQYALTIEGKIGNFDVTYAGAYMHRPNSAVADYTEYADAYDAYYETYYGGIAYYFHFEDDAGNEIDPRQYIVGGNNFKKLSQEIRIASPIENRFRVIAGAFYQRQSNDILQDYHVDNLAAAFSVNGSPGILWRTKQERIDRDYAVFGEASFDITPQITITGGARYYKFRNTVFGFAGFGRNPLFIQDANGDPIDPSQAPNAANSTRTGVAQCFTTSGDTLRESQINGTDTTLILDGALPGTPCTNVAEFDNGELKPKESKDTGWTYRVNGTWKPREGLMFYATRSTGYRPGGINRQPGLEGYDADFLINNEIGWKTTFGPFRWNGAIYHQKWKEFQFSFLGENSLTVVQNGRDAKINGIETDVNYTRGGLTLNAAAAYTDAKLKENICDLASDPLPDCDLILVPDDPGTPEDETETDFIVAPKGTRLPVTPKFKLSATARYAWDVGPGRAHGQIGLVYQGKARAALGTAEQEVTGNLPSSILVDLFAGYNWSRYSVELFGTNIFDERNQLSRFFVCGANCETNEFLHIVPGRPRTIGLRLGAKF